MLLFGGRSAEHDVSRVTAVAVAKALDPERYEVVPVAISKDGRWLRADRAREALDAGVDALPAAFEVEGSSVEPSADPGRPSVIVRAGAVPEAVGIDVVLPLLHGPFGEDGTVQGLLELAGLPYVGAGVLGSAVAMDKIAMKRMLAAAGIPHAGYLAFRDGHDRTDFADRVEAELRLPCFVKPSNMGSSVGVSKAHDRIELEEAIDLALEYDEWILAEEAIVGREIEVGVLGDDPPEASIAGEVVPGAEYYSYSDKYEDGSARLLVPAELDAASAEAVRALAVEAFDACRCEAMARVDFFYEESGAARGFLVNELNTIPGFTPISMYPRLWEASGVSYPALIDRLIDQAIARRDRRAGRAGRQRPGVAG